MIKTKKTLALVGCMLAVLGGVALIPSEGAAVPAQAVAAASTTAAAPADRKSDASGGRQAPSSAGGLEIARLVVATSVDEREPVGAASEFKLGAAAHLYAFVEVKNPTATATTIEVAWLDLESGKEQRSYTLEVQAHKRWRTWARTTAPKKPGAWAVLVRDEHGSELARTPYAITE